MSQDTERKLSINKLSTNIQSQVLFRGNHDTQSAVIHSLHKYIKGLRSERALGSPANIYLS